MARIEPGAERVDIYLSPLDEILALHGSLHLPYSHIRAVSHAPVPPDWFLGLRIGSNVPGVKVAGTFFTTQGTIFYDFHDAGHCLTFELVHEHYLRVVVEVNRDQDPEALAERITARL